MVVAKEMRPNAELRKYLHGVVEARSGSVHRDREAVQRQECLVCRSAVADVALALDQAAGGQCRRISSLP